MKMRKFKFLTVALLGMSTLFLTSCEDDTDDPLTPSPNLDITVLTSDNQNVMNDDVTVPSGTTIQFFINAVKTGDSDLNTFEINRGGTLSIGSLPETSKGYDYDTDPQNLKNADDETYRDTLTISGNLITNGEISMEFVVTNKDGKTTTQTILVTVDNPTPLNNEIMGAFFHIGGSSEGAYNLIAEETVPLSGADANKDMNNTDAAGTTFTGSWEALNSTNYVMDNAYDYDNATEESARDAYNNGTAMKEVTNPQVGDIFIAKLRGNDEYAVINITKVDPTDNTCNCANTGIIEFDFKKKQ